MEGGLSSTKRQKKVLEVTKKCWTPKTESTGHVCSLEAVHSEKIDEKKIEKHIVKKRKLDSKEEIICKKLKLLDGTEKIVPKKTEHSSEKISQPYEDDCGLGIVKFIRDNLQLPIPPKCLIGKFLLKMVRKDGANACKLSFPKHIEDKFGKISTFEEYKIGKNLSNKQLRSKYDVYRRNKKEYYLEQLYRQLRSVKKELNDESTNSWPNVKKKTVLQFKEEIKPEDEHFEAYEDAVLEASCDQINFEDIELKEEDIELERKTSDSTLYGDNDQEASESLLIHSQNKNAEAYNIEEASTIPASIITDKREHPISRPSNNKKNMTTHLANDVLLSVRDRFKKPQTLEDRYDHLGKTVALRVRGLEKRQGLIAEKMINDILFEAEMGCLSMPMTS